MLREPCLRNNTTIDVLYLDNTNCDPTRSIPTRQRACQQIKEIIRAHPNYAVVIGEIHSYNNFTHYRLSSVAAFKILINQDLRREEITL